MTDTEIVDELAFMVQVRREQAPADRCPVLTDVEELLRQRNSHEG